MKTNLEMLNDGYNKAMVEPYIITQINENEYSIYNELSDSEYILDVNNNEMKVLSCTCKHYIYRCIDAGISCKHMIALANYLNYNY